MEIDLSTAVAVTVWIFNIAVITVSTLALRFLWVTGENRKGK